MPDILIVGYGNPMRGDDAVGCLAAQELERQFHDDPAVRVVVAQQLTLEMAEDVSRHRFVIFLDAAVTEEPGSIRSEIIAPSREAGGFSHHLTPSSLLSVAQQLYSCAPEAMSLTLAGWSFELSSELSPDAKSLLPEMVRLAQAAVEKHRRRPPSGEAVPEG